MFEFVLVVSLLNDFSNPQYVGHFNNCDVAMKHKHTHYSEYKSARCLHEDFIYLPKLIKKKEIEWK